MRKGEIKISIFNDKTRILDLRGDCLMAPYNAHLFTYKEIFMTYVANNEVLKSAKRCRRFGGFRFDVNFTLSLQITVLLLMSYWEI